MYCSKIRTCWQSQFDQLKGSNFKLLVSFNSIVNKLFTVFAIVFIFNLFLLLLLYPFQILKLYKRFIKAESFRKALVYQKKYLLLLLGGFQDCESTTLAMISQMGVYPGNSARSYRRTGTSRFRTVARAVLAIQRMNFLVNKSKRVSIAGSRESTSRSRVVSGDVSSHTIYQAPASTYVPRSTGDVAHAGPTLNLYQDGEVPSYTERYSPRSDRRTYEVHNMRVNGDVDYRNRSVKPSTAASSERFIHREDASATDVPLSPRSYPTTSIKSPRTYSPKSWSDSRTSAAPKAREPITSDYTRILKSPPVRDTVSSRRDYSDHDRLESTPRHSSPNRRDRLSSPTPRYDDVIDRPLSPSGASSVGSVHNGNDSADHSLNLYIHRLESLQNRLGAINRGKTLQLMRSSLSSPPFSLSSPLSSRSYNYFRRLHHHHQNRYF